MDKDLKRLEELYNCRFYYSSTKEHQYLELYSKNKFAKDNINHIEHILKQYGYYFYTIEAMFDELIVTYYKK